MSSGSSVVGEPLREGAPLDAGDGGAWRRYGVVALFLGPAAIFLIVWVVYPTVYTIGRSFFGRDGFQDFVWFDNYKSLFSDHVLRTAIKNNVIWVAVVPALVTAIGLVFAVLTERIRWSVAFKTAVFMPMAISLFATGVIWRLMYQEDPQRGTVNAVIGVFHDAVRPPGVLTDASPSTETLTGTPQTGLVLKVPVRAGSVVLLGLTGIAPEDVPGGAKQAVLPPAKQGAITGVVWRDFKPGGGTPGKVEQDELGLPGVQVELRDAAGKNVQTATHRGRRHLRVRRRREWQLPPGDRT